jgi:hypothetical protein
MSDQKFNRLKISMMIGVVLFQMCCLAWEYVNGGVVTHHFFMRSDLPGVSNWWGLVILPALVWWAAVRVEKRVNNPLSQQFDDSRQFYRGVLIAFITLLLVSLVQSTIFSFGYANIAMFFLLGLMLAAIFVPLHKMECILGYVLGATFFTGPAMPFVGVVIFSVVSVLSHLCIKPLFIRIKNVKKAAS